MRKTVIATLAASLFASTLSAQPIPRSVDVSRSIDRVPGASWVTKARISPLGNFQLIADAVLAEAKGNSPIAIIETNYYTFLPGEPVQVRITVSPNGFTGAATMYLYLENRTTGERRYHNIANRGLHAAGTTADLFGSVGAPVPIVIPELTDFVLFGSATDTAALSFGSSGALGASMVAPAGQTGLHQWVLEIRDAAGKRVISRSNAMFSYISESVPVSGTITASTTWTANKRYVMSGFVGVAEPAVLTIEPGTVIYGGDSRATLFIRRGAKIVADGTARRPVIFTSPQRVGGRAQRDWGSLVMLGRAPINEPAGQGGLEGLPSTPEYQFGGTNAGDSSGVLRYLRLEFGGFPIEQDQEINGLTLGGVGNGTIIDHVQVLHNKDDGFEFFGGTVNASHLLALGVADDPIDWDLGFRGDIQFVAAIKRGVNDENDGNVGIEGDNHPQNHTLQPLTNPRIYNMTAYGTGRTDLGNYGAVLRRGTAGKIHNLIIMGSRRAPVTIRDDASFNNIPTNELVLDNSILFGNFGDSGFQSGDPRAANTRTFLFETMKKNRNVDPLLAIGAPTLAKTLMPDLTPLPNSPALDADFVAVPPDNGFFKPVDFIGAVAPGDNWILSGWANFSDN